MNVPLAYHLTWTTYGTWLPGDPRSWVKKGDPVVQAPNPEREEVARSRMVADPVILDKSQQTLVEDTVRKHCHIRGWVLHVVRALTNHVHVVVSANLDPETIRDQLKAWCSRQLSEQAGRRRTWWTEKGWAKWIENEEYLENAIRYVLEGQ